jgi:hypothetical protein
MAQQMAHKDASDRYSFSQMIGVVPFGLCTVHLLPPATCFRLLAIAVCGGRFPEWSALCCGAAQLHADRTCERCRRSLGIGDILAMGCSPRQIFWTKIGLIVIQMSANLPRPPWSIEGFAYEGVDGPLTTA